MQAIEEEREQLAQDNLSSGEIGTQISIPRLVSSFNLLLDFSSACVYLPYFFPYKPPPACRTRAEKPTFPLTHALLRV